MLNFINNQKGNPILVRWVLRFLILLFLTSLYYLIFVFLEVDSTLFFSKVQSRLVRQSLPCLFKQLFGGWGLVVSFLMAILSEEFFSACWMNESSSGWTSFDLQVLDEPFSKTETEMGEPSSVNQEVTRPVPPANPVASGEAEAGPSHGVTPFPYEANEVIGGDSVQSIQNRILGQYDFPTPHEIDMARDNARDLFEVKVEIIRLMQGLHPGGDWLNRGARALDNPRTTTGEESLEKLYAMWDDLRSGSFQSETFRLLVERVHLRAADEDEHSAA